MMTLASWSRGMIKIHSIKSVRNMIFDVSGMWLTLIVLKDFMFC